MLAAFEAACWAAKGVPLRDPRNPSDPELFHERTLPFMSVIVTIVLLKDACTYTSPWGTCLRSFFLKVFFLPFFSVVAVALTESAIGAYFDEPLDVHRNFLAQIAFHQSFRFDHGTDAVDLFLAQVLDLLHRVHLGLIENASSARLADAVNIGQCYIDVLLARKIHARNTCHVS